MSRCFPFPPPGYEKKPRPEVGDLLKEEKRREKKHKKEKKDREKKEKKDKERSDGKHREKKDKKDKHRDKKDKKDKENKDKDKDKDNERSSISEEARVAVLPGASSGPKIPRGDDHVKNESSINSYEPKFVKTSLPAVETQESKFVQELARRIRDEPKAAGSMYIKGNLAEDKEKNKEKRVYCNNAGGIDANAIHPSFPEVAKSKYLGMPRPLEESVGNSRDEKEESKKKDKKEKDKRSRGKEKDREKEKKKEETVKNKSADRKSKQDSSSREINKNDFVGVNNTTNVQVPLVPKDNIAGTITDGNLRKRKDIGTNGFLHNHEIRTPKLLRPTSPPWPIQNGTRFETHQKADMLPSSIQVVVANSQALKKEHSLNGTTKLSNTHGVPNDNPVEITNEHGVNGTVKTQSLVISKPKASSSTSPSADQIAEAAKRLPHPDTKYLNRILSVPKMDEWTGFHDQEWLFGSKHSLVKKPDSCLDEVKDYRVWSEALQIDSADVFALPYVIPY